MKLKDAFCSAAFVLVVMFVSRMATVGFPALIDTSDGRYASVAANMVIDNNWVVPRVHQEGEIMGYWSKPPLAFWTQAGSIGLFGFNEWAVRMPGVLWLALAVALSAWLAERWMSRQNAALAAVLTASTTLVFAFGSMTMTDQPLMAAFVGAMIGFALFFDTLNPWWARLGFACFGLALLSKGPVGLMMPAASLGAYVLLTNSWTTLLKIPWGTGLLAMLAVAAPWYLAMEQQQPGFLRYFLMDENFNRLISGSLTLRHGTAHPTFRGFVFVCFLIVTFPWICLVPRLVKRAGWRALLPASGGALVLFKREMYLMCWFAAPLLPLAVGEQVLPYYLLPLVPGFVLWFVMVSERLELLPVKKLIFSAAVTALIYTAILVGMGPLGLDARRSTRPIIEALAQQVKGAVVTVAFADRVPDSGYFYLASPVSENLLLISLPVERIARESPTEWVIIRKKDLEKSLLPAYREVLHRDKWVLLQASSDPSTSSGQAGLF